MSVSRNGKAKLFKGSRLSWADSRGKKGAFSQRAKF